MCFTGHGSKRFHLVEFPLASVVFPITLRRQGGFSCITQPPDALRSRVRGLQRKSSAVWALGGSTQLLTAATGHAGNAEPEVKHLLGGGLGKALAHWGFQSQPWKPCQVFVFMELRATGPRCAEIILLLLNHLPQKLKSKYVLHSTFFSVDGQYLPHSVFF